MHIVSFQHFYGACLMQPFDLGLSPLAQQKSLKNNHSSQKIPIQQQLVAKEQIFTLDGINLARGLYTNK